MLYKLFQKKVFHIEPGLERIKKACEELGNPQNDFPSILISGTNGKGSTSAYLESLLRYHGFRTGMFTSPHLVEENERWQINRENIPDKILEEYIKGLKPIIQKHNLTYFEASTLLAFKYFSDQKVDIAVLEVGLGGRWDSTNIVEPELSVITNVSLDHTHLLGDSIQKIAFEKVGISRKNKPLIIGSPQKEIKEEALKKGVKEIYQFKKDFDFKMKGQKMDYHFDIYDLKNLNPSLIGKRQFNNLATALTAFIVFAEKEMIPLSFSNIREAVSNTRWQGRMQILSKDPFIILDGAHNEDAIKKTYEEIKELFPEKEIITIYSGMKDKNIEEILKLISKNSKKVFVSKIPVSRSLTEEDLEPTGLNFEYIPDIEKSISKAKSELIENQIILITGSLYLAGEVLKQKI